MKYYLLSICVLPVLYWFVGIFFPHAGAQLPLWLTQAIWLYFITGAVVLLLDLWRSKRISDDDRLWWTLVLLCFGFLLAPLYWFIAVNKTHKEQLSSQPSSR